MRKHVVFLGLGTTPENFEAKATAFMVIVEDDSGIDGAYLVTAGHVARELQDIPFQIRLNKRGNDSDLDYIDGMEWRYHDKFPNVDIAIAHYMPPLWADIAYASTDDFVTERHIIEVLNDGGKWEDTYWDIGAGDAVYVIGLFNLLQGKKRNAQFVYNGRIALMPGDDTIPTTDRQTKETIECEGYLVEVQTLPGASGSSVLTRGTVAFTARQAKHNNKFLAYAHTRAWLLGLYQGSWERPPEALFQRARGTTATRVPMGMGIVVPAFRIREVLMYDDVVKARQDRRKKRISANAAVQDTTF